MRLNINNISLTLAVLSCSAALHPAHKVTAAPPVALPRQVTQNAGKSSATKSIRDYVLMVQGCQAYGLYLNQKKMGWLIAEIKLEQHNGKEVARYITNGYFTLRYLDDKVVVEKSSVITFDLEGDGQIQTISSQDRENGKVRQQSAHRDGKELIVTTTVAGQKKQRRVALPRETLRQYLKQYDWLTSAQPGSSIEAYTTSLDDDAVETKQAINYVSKKMMVWGGVPTPVFIVRVQAHGSVYEVEQKADGTLIKAKMGSIFDMRAEEETSAKQMDANAIDMLEVSAIGVNTDLGEPKNVTALTLKVMGLGNFKMPESPRQRVQRGTDGVVTLQVSKDTNVKPATPLTPSMRVKYLEDTPSYQIKDAQIVAQAKGITQGEQQPVKAATLLSKWIYINLKKRMASNATSAPEVLEARSGDCTEHSLLFVALARAVGIPAREVGGVAFSFVGRPLFAWHEWAEIHDGTQWVTIDPTWDEVYVDATHIKFSEGNDDYAWLQVLGNVKFEVVQFRTGS